MADEKKTSAVEKKAVNKTAPSKDSKTKGKAGKFFRDLRGEFKKVVWPTRQAVIKNTAVTVAMCLLVAIVVGGVDYGLGAFKTLFNV